MDAWIPPLTREDRQLVTGLRVKWVHIMLGNLYELGYRHQATIDAAAAAGRWAQVLR